MNHLTFLEVVWYVDGSMQGVTRDAAESHLAKCIRCRNEAEIQKQISASALALGSQTVPGEDLKQRVMTTVAPGRSHLLGGMILNNLGNGFAMMFVLGLIGYVLFGSPLASPVFSNQPTILDNAVAKGYSLFKESFVSAYRLMPVRQDQTDGPSLISLFGVVILSFIVLFFLDKFFAKQLRRKHI